MHRPPGRQPKTILPQLLEHQEAHRQAELDSPSVPVRPPQGRPGGGASTGSPAKTYGSQGQTRTAALSLKLAQREIFLQETGEWPVLLLDDVLSELDAPAAGLRPQPHPGRAGVYFLL